MKTKPKSDGRSKQHRALSPTNSGRTRRVSKASALRAVQGSTLSYTDIDGDKVTITSSRGDLAGHATIIQGQLRVLDLSGPAFNGANISFAVVRTGNGDGLAAVGRINGGSNNFGTIVVQGDLGAITAGSGSAGTPAIQNLRVHSMGIYGLATQGNAGDLHSVLIGTLGSLTVASDFKEAIVSVTGAVGPVSIGGSMIGGVADQSGSITASERLGQVTIGGSVIGGSGVTSGAVACTKDVAGVIVGGSLVGGSGFTSGVIFSAQGATGPVKIGGNVVGGAGTFTGRVFGRTRIASVTVGGSLLGGLLNDSGRIHTDGDMGPVRISGDVKAGAGLNTGSIDSAGKMGAVTIGGSFVGAAGGGKISSLGDMGPVKIEHDILGGSTLQSGQIFSGGKLASITIGGSVIGGAGDSGALIFSGGDMGAVRIGGNILGGPGGGSAFIDTHGKIASIAIGGSLLGGTGGNSGQLRSRSDMGAVKIGGDVRGRAIFSGLIDCGGNLAAVTIGRSLFGGTANKSGTISSTGDIGVISIGGDLVGGSVSGNAPKPDRSGFIESIEGRISAVVIGGSVLAGISQGGFGLLRNASISAGDDIGSIVIRGGVLGTIGSGGEITRVVFTARGQATPTATKDLAIGKVTIDGRAEWLRVLGGYASNLLPLNGNAQIGPITIGGDLIASDLIAGVKDTSGRFGNSSDTIIGNLPNSIAQIRSIVIGGVVIGRAEIVIPGTGDLFGIESHTIGSLRIAGFLLPITSPLPLSPITGNDVVVREVP